MNNPLSLNLYTYVGNNPLVRWDPNGHSWIGDVWNNGIAGMKKFGEKMWYDLVNIDQGSLALINFLLVDDLRTLTNPNSSSLSRAMAIVGFIPLGKTWGAGKKLYVEIMNGGQRVLAEVNASVKWLPYTKHIPQKNMIWKDIVKSTANGKAARYKPGIDIEALERYAWEYGTQTKSRELFKVMKFDNVIGANSGKETKYMRVEMNSNGEIHGHPITEDKYNSYLK